MLSKVIKINNQKKSYDYKIQKRELVIETAVLSGIGLIGVLGVAISRIKVGRTDQRILKTGLFINGITVSQITVQWPFQNINIINLIPENYTFELKAMTSEKIEFRLPGVFTIGPENESEALKKYGQFLSGNHDKMTSIILGILEGETRVLAAGLKIEDIFAKRDEFKQKIVELVEEELKKFGLRIWNANIKELSDTEGNNYFSNMKQKTLQQANAFATIEIAESKKNSQIGIKERESTTRQKNAELETQAITIENETKQKIAESQAQLDVKNAETMRIGEMARISAQKDIEIAKIELMEQSLRNRELSQAKVNAEVLIKKNEGDKRAIEIESDAKLYAAKQDSEAKKLKADAELYFQQKNAEGIQAIYESQAKGLQQMLNSLNGDTSVLLKIRGIDTKLYETLAKEASNAVQGMQPKINIWNTGNQSDKSISNILSGIVSGIPPMLDALQSQTDISFSKKSESLKNHIESKN